jgi:hypothetical protein
VSTAVAFSKPPATAYFTEAGLRALIRNPAGVRTWPGQQMPGFDVATLGDSDIDAVIAYLRYPAARSNEPSGPAFRISAVLARRKSDQRGVPPIVASVIIAGWIGYPTDIDDLHDFSPCAAPPSILTRPGLLPSRGKIAHDLNAELAKLKILRGRRPETPEADRAGVVARLAP